jgi:hypothetical protein
MLVDVLLLQPFGGVSCGQHTQLSSELAERLVELGIAEYLKDEKTKSESTKKTGK